MSAALRTLARNRSLELVVAVSLGYTVARLAESVAAVPVTALAQLRSDGDDVLGAMNLFSGGVYLLNIEIGSVLVFYGGVVAALVALGLVALLATAVVRRRDRELGECPFCASRIPYESQHCAYCGSGVEPGDR